MLEACPGCGGIPNHLIGSPKCQELRATIDWQREIERDSLEAIRESFKKTRESLQRFGRQVQAVGEAITKIEEAELRRRADNSSERYAQDATDQERYMVD